MYYYSVGIVHHIGGGINETLGLPRSIAPSHLALMSQSMQHLKYEKTPVFKLFKIEITSSPESWAVPVHGPLKWKYSRA